MRASSPGIGAGVAHSNGRDNRRDCSIRNVMVAFVWSLLDLFANLRSIGLPDQQIDPQDRTTALDSALSCVIGSPAGIVQTDRESAAAHMP